MPRDRYTDRQLEAMERAASAMEALADHLPLRDFLSGKILYLRGEMRFEAEAREAEIAAMFVPPAVQLANLADWNARHGWGFGEEVLAAIAAQAPEPIPRDGLKAQVLEIMLPDGPDGAPGHRRTLDELWKIVMKRSGVPPIHLFGLAKGVRLELAPGQSHAPGLRWRTIDLGANWGTPHPSCRNLCGVAPRSLPHGAERPHAGILSAAAHFPLWLKRMDGRKVPYVWLPGYELPGFPGHAVSGAGRIVYHPCLSRGGRDGEIFLYAHWDHVPFDDYAVPEYR